MQRLDSWSLRNPTTASGDIAVSRGVGIVLGTIAEFLFFEPFPEMPWKLLARAFENPLCDSVNDTLPTGFDRYRQRIETTCAPPQ